MMVQEQENSRTCTLKKINHYKNRAERSLKMAIHIKKLILLESFNQQELSEQIMAF